MKSIVFTILIAIFMISVFEIKAQQWNMSEDYSLTNNPTGAWSYGRKWSPESTSFDLLTQLWSPGWWWMGNFGNGAPAVMIWSTLPSLWAKYNSNGLPVIRWTCPVSGIYSMISKFNGIDSRGVDDSVYITLDDSIIFLNRLRYYNDSTNFSFSNVQIDSNSHVDFIVKWAGGVYSEYGVVETNAIITTPGVTPKHGGNKGNVTLSITGDGFMPGVQAKLTRPGQPDIIANPITIQLINSKKILATFAMNNAELVIWNVIITNPDSSHIDFLNAFTVQPVSINAAVSIVGSSPVRVGRNVLYYCNISNTGNIDLDYVIVRLSVGTNCRLMNNRTSYAWDVLPLDTLPNDTIMLIGYSIPPSSVKQTPFTLNALSTGTISLQDSVWVFDSEQRSSMEILEDWGLNEIIPTNMSNPSNQFPPPPPSKEGTVVFQDNDLKFGHIAIYFKINGNPFIWENLVEGGTQITSWYNFCLRTYPTYLKGDPQWEQKGFCDYVDRNLTPDDINKLRDWCLNNLNKPYYPWYKCTEAVLQAFNDGIQKPLFPGYTECHLDGPTLYHKMLSNNPWPTIGSKLWALGSIISQAQVLSLNCGMLKMAIDKLINIPSVQSMDPNNKASTIGYGDKNYISDLESLYYIVNFENIATATASAENISISDTLSSNLDWSTFVFDSTSHKATLKSFNLSQGIVKWVFDSINLPPNVNPPQGEGWVMYHINQKPNLSSGTQITNRASIKFDFNNPMLTNTTINTIDTASPVSAVKQGPMYLGDYTYLISWSGHDETNGSGIQDYTVYISESANNNYQPWKRNVADTFATFKGDPGKTYYFYSLARDGVGHIEAPKATYDLALITVGIKENSEATSGYLHIYPNPSNGRTNVEFSNPQHKNYKLSVINLFGSIVLEKFDISGDKVEINGGNLSPGIYYIRLQGVNVLIGKMVVE